MKYLMLILMVLMLFGCASTNEHDVEIIQSQLMAQQSAIAYQQALANRPTIKFECKDECKLEVFDYDELPELPKPDHYVSAHESNVQMTESVMRNLVPIVGIVGLTKFGSDALDAAGNGDNYHQTTTINGDDNGVSNEVSRKTTTRTAGDTISRTVSNKSDSSSVTTDGSNRSIVDNTNNSNTTIDNSNHSDNSVIDNTNNSSIDNTNNSINGSYDPSEMPSP